MSTKVHISPKILGSISSLYNDTNRIFMEYIDNSIDSADQNYFNQTSSSYSRPINITLKIEGKNAKDGKVTIIDNCFGITNFTKIAGSIGDSDKKEQAWTNGQFGYGIYSFMAACAKLEVSSKNINSNALLLPISREEFNKARQEDINLPDPKVINNFPNESGTKIELSQFDKEMWKNIDIKILQNEIEKHFELILKRKNLSIKLFDADNNEYICNSFNYDEYEGEIYEDYLTDFHIKRGEKRQQIITIPVKTPVHILLKMTHGVTISKAPVFISKGRRICEIKDVKSFRSNHKNDIWGHPNVTGYIDLHDMLGPTIARNDFKNNNESKALYQTLLDLEEIIFDFVKKANSQSEDKHYQQLEDVLNKALSKLARIDTMNYRTDYTSGGAINLANGGDGIGVEEGLGGHDFGGGNEIENPGEGVGENEGNGLTPSDKDGILPSDGNDGDQANNKEDINESEFSGSEKKKSGFNIKISEQDPQVDGLTGKECRSIWDGNSIVIYKNHPDFQSRVSHTRQGETKITERLISFLASEITVHYKDLFYQKTQNGQPEYNKNMFINLVDFIYQFEKMLQDFSGRNLSEFK